MRRLLIAGALCAVLATNARAGNWPQWRGPQNNGISAESGPVKWSATENVAWKLDLPGPAGATPVVWGDHIFLTAAAKKNLVLLCVSTEGKELWRRRIATGNKRVRGDEGNYASPSPCTDGEHVWTFMGNGALACYDFKGNLKWETDLQERYGKFEIQFGLSSTPVLYKDRLLVQLIHGKWNKTPSLGKIVALDKATGKEIWAKERSTDAIDECKQSYASPIVYADDKRA
ncbi:MAG: PQQ-binding-like beta-propeller repeat protein, partial [Planctomycetota bacterium]